MNRATEKRTAPHVIRDAAKTIGLHQMNEDVSRAPAMGVPTIISVSECLGDGSNIRNRTNETTET